MLPENTWEHEAQPYCTHCNIAARDKEWAEWILDKRILPNGVYISSTDFEALKKLKGG